MLGQILEVLLQVNVVVANRAQLRGCAGTEGDDLHSNSLAADDLDQAAEVAIARYQADDIEPVGHGQDIHGKLDVEVPLHRAVTKTLERLCHDPIAAMREWLNELLRLEALLRIIADRRVGAGPDKLPPAREMVKELGEVDGDANSLGSVDDVGHVDENAYARSSGAGGSVSLTRETALDGEQRALDR